jgi:transcription elongation factor GreA
MEEQKVVVTKDGLQKLVEERDHLVHIERQEVIEELQNARSMGDLSENADYDAARDHQARVEARVRELDEMLKNIEIIEEKAGSGKNNVVRLGSTVTIKMLDNNQVETYTIVGTVESDPLNGKLSNETALALALQDHKRNDVVSVQAEIPYQVKIVSIA